MKYQATLDSRKVSNKSYNIIINSKFYAGESDTIVSIESYCNYYLEFSKDEIDEFVRFCVELGLIFESPELFPKQDITLQGYRVGSVSAKQTVFVHESMIPLVVKSFIRGFEDYNYTVYVNGEPYFEQEISVTNRLL